MSERLNKLRYQKQLIEQHLAWLNQEIDVESKKVPQQSTVTVKPAEPVEKIHAPAEPVIQPHPPQPDVQEEDIEEISEQLISRYAGESDRREMNPKVGCVLYFIGALAFIVAVIYAIYWFGYR